MADAQHLYCPRKDHASQVVPVRNRTSAHRIDTVCSCELNGRLSLRVFGRSPHESPVSAIPQQSPGVTYVPGLFCHPCSRPHAGVRPPAKLRAGQRNNASIRSASSGHVNASSSKRLI